MAEAYEAVQAALAQRDDLLAALEPFAEFAAQIGDWMDDDDVVFEGPHGVGPSLTVGQIRHAAAVVAKARGEAK